MNRAETRSDQMIRKPLIKGFVSNKAWKSMSKAERNARISQIVLQSSSEEELRTLLTQVSGMPCFSIDWHSSDESDNFGKQADMPVIAPGHFISKNGDLVMVMTINELF